MDFSNKTSIQWVTALGNAYVYFPCAITWFSKITVGLRDNNSAATGVRCSISDRNLTGFYIQTCWVTEVQTGWADMWYDAVIIGF